jgi:hypothetical protein
MKTNVKKTIKFQWSIHIFLLIIVIGVFLTNNLFAKTTKEIDANVDKDGKLAVFESSQPNLFQQRSMQEVWDSC